MNRKLIVMSVFVAILALLVGSASAQQGTPPNQPQALASSVTTSFTYQGQVKKNGGAYTGACNFKFSLWDAVTAGAQQGTTQNATGVNVANGLFTVELNFGDQFKGDARWLEIAVDCGDGAFTTMTPRVLMTSSPYALGVRPGAQISGTLSGTAGILRATNMGPGAALVGLANSSTGVTYGVLGNAFSPQGSAVLGYSDGGATGVRGYSDSTGAGVWGSSIGGAGVYGESTNFNGVRGVAHNVNNGAVVGIHDGGGFGVYGSSPTGAGVVGVSGSWVGVYGESASQTAVWGKSTSATGVGGTSDTYVGVWGESTSFEGVRGVSHNKDHGGVVGVNDAAGGIAVYGIAPNGGYAAWFNGRTKTNVMEITGGADLAERFTVSDDKPEPGTLMVIDVNNPGQLKASNRAYDTTVAGIISGAGGVNPGLTLHQDGVMEGDTHVAIAGRVYVKATAVNGAIQPGDLLTTSDVPGHAMKATDRDQAYGAVIGKALTGLDNGEGLVLVIVNLQ